MENCGQPARGRGLCSRHYQQARNHGWLPPLPSPRTCQNCGRQYSPRKWTESSYCSSWCRDEAEARRKRESRPRQYETCQHCGASLQDKRPNSRFCDEQCCNDFHNAQRSVELKQAKEANLRPCAGCDNPIPANRKAHALYCSEECKSRSRRHEAYGLSKAELDLLLAQHEVCAICITDEWGGKGPQVDHCHATGRVRGVLCTNCNAGLGRFDDDPVRLRAAADYLGSKGRTVNGSDLGIPARAGARQSECL